MTDPTNRDDREERAILAALERLEGDASEGAAEPALDREPESEADATLRRLSVESLGLLPWALEPETPSAGARDRLLAALPAAPAAEASVPVRLIGSARRPGSAAAPAPERRSWAGWLAAALVVAALGLAGVAGWLWLELGEAREALAAARGALTASEIGRSELAERLSAQEAQLRRSAGMGKFVAAASTAGVEICPLRPVGDPALHPEAFAVLYMPPGSEQWYLVASNLEPGEGGAYRVWLNTPDGPVPVGRLDVGEGATLEFVLPPDIGASHERMLSIAVTLEAEDGEGSQAPAGPMVLFGDEKMTVL